VLSLATRAGLLNWAINIKFMFLKIFNILFNINLLYFPLIIYKILLLCLNVFLI